MCCKWSFVLVYALVVQVLFWPLSLQLHTTLFLCGFIVLKMHLSGHSWLARSGTSSLFHHQISPGLTAISIMCSTSRTSACHPPHNQSPPPDRLSQLQLNVVGSVGTLPAVCDTFCLRIDPAVGRWIFRFSLRRARPHLLNTYSISGRGGTGDWALKRVLDAVLLRSCDVRRDDKLLDFSLKWYTARKKKVNFKKHMQCCRSIK